MRKILIVAGLLMGAALFTTSSTPAQAWVGCSCATLNKAPVCVEGPGTCLTMGGACVLPCDYVAPKAVKHHRHKKKK